MNKRQTKKFKRKYGYKTYGNMVIFRDNDNHTRDVIQIHNGSRKGYLFQNCYPVAMGSSESYHKLTHDIVFNCPSIDITIPDDSPILQMLKIWKESVENE